MTPEEFKTITEAHHIILKYIEVLKLMPEDHENASIHKAILKHAPMLSFTMGFLSGLHTEQHTGAEREHDTQG